jgi:hypothetical protein
VCVCFSVCVAVCVWVWGGVVDTVKEGRHFFVRRMFWLSRRPDPPSIYTVGTSSKLIIIIITQKLAILCNCNLEE